MITFLLECFDIPYNINQWVCKYVMVFMDNLYFICWKVSI